MPLCCHHLFDVLQSWCVCVCVYLVPLQIVLSIEWLSLLLLSLPSSVPSTLCMCDRHMLVVCMPLAGQCVCVYAFVGVTLHLCVAGASVLSH